MIEQKAKVISTDKDVIWVEAERTSTCSSCKVKKGCGTGMLAEHVGKRFSRISVPKKDNVSIGQDVQLAIPEEALLQGAFYMYILPLLFMFLGAALAQILNLNEFVEIIFGLSGLSIGFLWVKRKLNARTDDFKAQIVEE